MGDLKLKMADFLIKISAFILKVAATPWNTGNYVQVVIIKCILQRLPDAEQEHTHYLFFVYNDHRIPVSYTHLDVYKRQSLDSVIC